MNWLIKKTTGALDLAQGRFDRSRFRLGRRGSVLIIVIGLLVLMAIIGTAYISTARVDRQAAATNAENTEADLQLKGAEAMAISQIVNDINPATGTSVNKYRTAVGGYTPYNSAINDQWLSDRVPTLLDPTQNYSASNPPVWHFLTLPITNVFTDPTTGLTYGSSSSVPATTNINGTRCDYAPTWKPYTYTSNGQSMTVQLPALTYLNADNGQFSGTHVAADTDDDGVADAGLIRMPGGEISGITWFGAYRIIDNAAAINAAVAWAPQPLYAEGSAQSKSTNPPYVPGNFNPTNVNLNGLICSGDSLSNLDTYRFGSGPNTTPSQGSGYAYETVYDAAWHELGRRLQNPNHGSGYQALGVSDMAAMAHRFVIRDAGAAPSLLDYYLPGTVYNNAPTSAYLPSSSSQYASEVASWYQTNFNYAVANQGATAGYANSLRSLLVTRNGVTTFTASKYGPNANAIGNTNITLPGAAWSTAPTNYPMYSFGDWVKYNNHAYVCIQPNVPSTTNEPSTTAVAGSNYYKDNQWWVYEPWVNSPVKTNVNTATFGQLWLAYWNVMCDSQNAAPAPQANSTSTVGTNMFRSSLRYFTGGPSNNTTPGSPLSATQELQLRAAIAAVNTIDLRNTYLPSSTNTNTPPTTEGGPGALDYVTQLPIMSYYNGSTPTAQYNATVYGTKPQPFIAAIYANNDPTLVNSSVGYVAVELYNPYPYPLTLTGWALVYGQRQATAGGTLSYTPIDGTVNGSSNWQNNPPTIPANGFCVLANAATPANFTTGPTATVGSATDPLYIVSGLEKALGNELVLMRPTSSAASAGGPNSGTSSFTFANAAPVDCYDFKGLETQQAFVKGDITAGTGCFEWTYFRDSLSSDPWCCVYPGAFDPNRGKNALQPRFLATNSPQSIANAGQPATTDLSFLGQAHAGGTGYTDTADGIATAVAFKVMPIQLNNVDFGGPIKLNSSGNYFPFGGFARDADIMQVPFIGGYKIYDSTGTNLVEMNPVTLDAAYAAQTNGGDETSQAVANQNIGRFAPWYGTDYGLGNMAGTGTPAGWETRLLSYLTVTAPSDDYAPETNPLAYPPGTPAISGVANANSTVVNAVTSQSITEDTVPIQGLININTAPWRVLATLPFSDDPNTNAALAQAIVNYRDGYYATASQNPDGAINTAIAAHGPFQNLFDLNAVAASYNANLASANPSPTAATGVNPNSYTPPEPLAKISFYQTLGSYNTSGIYANAYSPNLPSHAPTNNDGMITPNYGTATANSWPTSSGVNNDFQNWNLALARVSNLITTRSDSYTVYVLVQGWTNAGTANAKMVVQRRAAFIVDRSGCTPSNPTPSITNISTN